MRVVYTPQVTRENLRKILHGDLERIFLSKGIWLLGMIRGWEFNILFSSDDNWVETKVGE